MDKEELGKYNGEDGAAAYVAYKGKVYDASASKLWKGGLHMGSHRAGKDLTDFIPLAPHTDGVLDRLTVVDRLASADGGAAADDTAPPRDVTPMTRIVVSTAGPPESPSQMPVSPSNSVGFTYWEGHSLPTQPTVRLSRRLRWPAPFPLLSVPP